MINSNVIDQSTRLDPNFKQRTRSIDSADLIRQWRHQVLVEERDARTLADLDMDWRGPYPAIHKDTPFDWATADCLQLMLCRPFIYLELQPSPPPPFIPFIRPRSAHNHGTLCDTKRLKTLRALSPMDAGR